MYAWIDAWMDVWINKRADKLMIRWMDKRTEGWMHACMNAWTDRLDMVVFTDGQIDGWID